jgi:acetylornithine deacetylase
MTVGAAMTSELTPLERRVTDEVARRADDLTGLLSELVAFDTRTPEREYAPRDEAALQEYVAVRLRASGLAVRIWEPEAAELPRSRYPIPEGHHFRGRPQLIATATGTGGGRTLLFNGHVDVVTVEPRELWTSDPFAPEMRDGRLHGRGACDMKGGVACMLVATEVLRALEVPLEGDLVVNTVTDEESTGAGSLAVAASGLRADGGIIPEPTGLTAWLGTRGSLMPGITVDGRAGHAGLPPAHWTAGGPVNAIEKMQVVLEALQRLRLEWQLRPDTRHEVLAPGSIVPTALHSGQWMVSYPASSTLECHVQYVPGQADGDGYGTRVEQEIEARVLAAAQADSWLATHPPRFSWPGDVPAGFVDREQPISATTLDAMAALGLPRTIASRTTFFDGPTFTRVGIPTIAFGPGDISLAHAVDESVPVDELVRAAQVLAVAAMRFCGVRT